MEKMKSIHSLNRKLMIMVISFIVLFITLSSFVIVQLVIEDERTQSASNIKQWALMIANSNRKNLTEGNQSAVSESLTVLRDVNFIRYVHLYRVLPETEQIDFFASYNKNIDAPILEKSNRIEELSSVKFSSNIIEFMVPITLQAKTIGFVYIQANTKHMEKTIKAMTLRFGVLTCLLLFITIFVAVALNRYITMPMAKLATKVQTISKLKQFNLRLDSMPFKELDIIARNVNIMLSRVETQLAKLSDAEQLTIQQNKDLEDKVNKRTQALKDSNAELLTTLEKLHQFQGQLVESEKMASLGDMVAGVAHEVNTPIGLGVTASTLLSDRLGEIKLAFDDKTLKSSQLKKFLVDGEENTAIIYRNLKRAAELIASFKKVAVDQSSEEERTFNIKHLLEEVLLTLAPQIKKLPYVINIDCPDELVITSKPGPFDQIIINLIMNSITHGFDERDHGVITIEVSSENKMLTIHYQDDGKGIEPTIINKIFEPFTTTKRGSGGSGLGLHLVYNLVTQALGGKITFSSEVESGVNFTITIPT